MHSININKTAFHPRCSEHVTQKRYIQECKWVSEWDVENEEKKKNIEPRRKKELHIALLNQN